MDMINAYMQMNLSSIQQSISTVMLDKTLNQDAQSMATLLNSMTQANPVSEVPMNFEGTISRYI